MSDITVYFSTTDSLGYNAIRDLDELYGLGIQKVDSTALTEQKLKELKQISPVGTSTSLTIPLLQDGNLKLWGTLPILKYLAAKFQVADGKPDSKDPKHSVKNAVKRAVAEAALDLYSTRFVKYTTKVEGIDLTDKEDISKEFKKLLQASKDAIEADDKSKAIGLLGGDDFCIADVLFRALFNGPTIYGTVSSFKLDVNDYNNKLGTEFTKVKDEFAKKK
jgi:glutathione S-transferase